MADLEAVLADVSYLMAMEKSKSTPAARASKKIILPEPSIRSVMQKYLEERDELTFDKIFNQKIASITSITFFSIFDLFFLQTIKVILHTTILCCLATLSPTLVTNLFQIASSTQDVVYLCAPTSTLAYLNVVLYVPLFSGFLLFKDYCMNEIDEAVPQLKFYEEIKEYEKLDSEEERLSRSRQIYDGYIMKELLSCSHPFSKKAVDHVQSHLAKKQVPPSLFQPYIVEICDSLRGKIFQKFIESDKFTRFCQWKNVELNIHLTMNDFSVHRIIGRGGFGEVYGCRKADTGKMYAMKCLDKKRIKMKQGETLALNERIMLSLVSTGDCPFIVCMTYAFHTPDKLCFILDLMNGGDLHYHLSQHGVFSEKEMRFYAAEIILGLEHMHNRFVVYRDLKPANILLDEHGHVRISDLGLACDFSKKKPHASVGTHGYMAPEVLQKGTAYDSSADWFSLGCMLFKLLRGHSPFRQHKTKDKHEIDRMTLTMNVELPDSFSAELKSLLEGLLQRDVAKRLGCQGRGASEVKEHLFFKGIDWQQVYLQKYSPPLIPPRGEVNAADAFDIGSFDEEDTKGIKLLDSDQELYKNFPLVISERWQQEVAETVYEAVNSDTDKNEARKRAKNKQQGHEEDYALGKDCIMHGYMLKLGNPFLTQWQRRYFYLFPNRVEWRGEGESRQNLLTMEQIVTVEETQIKDKKCILLRIKGGKQFVLQCESDPEFVQWKKELNEAFTEAQKLLRRAPKVIGKGRAGVVELSKPPLTHRNSNGLSKIKDEKKLPPATQPPPPLSVVPGGFLKQLVRETEKETKQKEPELKEEKAPSKLSENLVQQFLLPDQTPPILEAEMALKAEQMVNVALKERKTSFPRQNLSPVSINQQDNFKVRKPDVNDHKQENDSNLLNLFPEVLAEKENLKDQTMAQLDVKEVKEDNIRDVRQDPEGQLTESTLREEPKKCVRDVWYEAGTVWYTHKNGFALATQLKPDEGTPELPYGKVRVRLQTDGSVHDVTQYEIEKMNPPELDLCEDLSQLVSVNESSILHTLTSRARAHMALTHAGPNLLALWPPIAPTGKGLRTRHWGTWEATATLKALVQNVYMSMIGQRRDQSVVAMGRSGTGKTTLCQTFARELLKHSGTTGENLTSQRLQAMFTVLHSFGCVSSHHSEASSRFAMVLSLDFNHKGLAAAGHLQTMMLERWRVCHRPEGESNFLIFSQMLAGLSPEMRTELQLHQIPENNIFGISCPTKVDEKQRATVEFGRLLEAMKTLQFSPDEQRAIWHVLAGIYHLGMAGTCKVGRKQFMSFESAQVASAVLGCEGEDLHTAVFKHHLRQLLQRATGASRERHITVEQEEGPKLSAAQCVEGMAAGLYEELFTAIVSLINRALCSQQLTLGSVIVVDAPGLRNPRHSGKDRAAGFSEFCHNYLQERLLEHHFTYTFTNCLDRYTQEKVSVDFEAPEDSPQKVVCAIDQPGLQVRGTEGDSRGLLWVLDEELVTPNSSENTVLERICHYFSDTVRQCEQPLQCEIAHLLGSDPIRYDLSGWFGLVQNNPSALNASSILQNSSVHVVKALFASRALVPPLCRGLGGVEGSSQRFLERSGSVRKTFTGGMAGIRRYSHCISIKLQVDALINLIRRAQPVFLQCLSTKVDGGGFDVPALRTQLHSTHLLPALQLYRIGYPDHMSLSDFRRRFQALSPPVMKSYGSVFITPNERKAVEELLTELDLDKKGIVLGSSKVFLKRDVLRSLDVQRDGLVNNWLVQMQAACVGHLARQKYRRLKVQQMAVKCIQRNIRVLNRVATWSWWKLLCRVRPLLDVNIDEHKVRGKEDEIRILRGRLEKSEKERNELRQTADSLETKIMAVVSELSDERFRGEAVSQALDTERAERLRLTKENKELQDRLDQSKVTVDALEKQLAEEKQKAKNKETLSGMATEGELQLQLDCAQTEVEFLRRRLRQTEERFEAEKEARELLDTKVLELQAQLEQSKRTVTELKRHCRHVTSDLQDARVLIDSLQARTHDLDRKQRRFDSELTRALEEADNEREQKDKAIQESIVLRAEIFSLHQTLKESRLEIDYLQHQKQELCAQIQDLTTPLNLGSDSVPELKKQLRELDSRDKEHAQELANMTAKIQQQEQIHLRFEMEMERMKQIHQKELEDKDEELEDVQKSSQRRLRQLEMQLEQEYEEKQMVVHEKHDLEGLIATLCEQVGHRDFDVEKRLRRDLKRTHALLSDAQLLLSTMEQTGPCQAPETKEQLERLHYQSFRHDFITFFLEESEARRLEAENVQKTLAIELENAQLELESICTQKSLVDEQLTQLQHEKTDFLKRLEEDQEDLNELMKKHKALIAQSSSDIAQIRELQAELEEVKKEKQSLQEQLQTSAAHLQFIESSTVARSIVSKQEARVCDLENKLEYQRGQVKRFEVLVLRLRDSVLRMGEELEQSAQAEAREKENSHYFQQRLADMKLEMEDLSLREQESSRRRMELEMQVEELSAVRQTLQADLETSIRRIADLQAALEEVESSDESDTERENASSVGSSIGTEESGMGIRRWLGVPRGSHKSCGSGVSSYAGSTTGSQSFTDAMSTISFRSCSQELEDVAESSRILPRATSSTALSELLEGLRKKRAGWDKSSEVDEGSTVSLPIYQPTAASTLRRRALTLSPDTNEGLEEVVRPGILKVPSPMLPHASSLRSLSESTPPAPSATSTMSKVNRFGSCDSLTSVLSSRQISNPSVLEERKEDPGTKNLPAPNTYQPIRHQLFRGLTAEGDGETLLGSEPLVFQNRHLLGNPKTDKDRVGSNLGDTNSAIIPAIRRSQSISSLASSSSRGGQRRALSVHFGELPPSRALYKDSDSDSSDSEGSQHQIGPQEKRLEAEGSEGDVNSVMKKYLRKAEVD
ncbi:hypothetical protein QTP70_018550 [Hemibagrus guttatus]|uniref:[beta-adrenergic-receptor] kinase n=3 Tax=Clupeocephala TaxID=186625 RepID=A0AAE0QIF5_9TELE|nr:hypothetical protein QTP70_018550 [Hemibagrus guttatus]